VENLLNRLPDIELAIPEDSLAWRPGPFHRALVALPARFTPVGVSARTAPPRTAAAPAPATSAEAPRKPERAGLWSQFLNWLR
jgi:hypothetical protein